MGILAVVTPAATFAPTARFVLVLGYLGRCPRLYTAALTARAAHVRWPAIIIGSVMDIMANMGDVMAEAETSFVTLRPSISILELITEIVETGLYDSRSHL